MADTDHISEARDSAGFGWRGSIRAWMSSIVHRPLGGSDLLSTRDVVAGLVQTALFIAAMAAVAVGSASLISSWDLSLMLGCVVVVVGSGALSIRFASGTRVDASDVFYAVVIAAMPLHEAAMVVLAGAVISSVLFSYIWRLVPFMISQVGMQFAFGLAAGAIVRQQLSGLNEATAVFVAAMAACAAFRIGEFVACSIDVAVNGAHSPRAIIRSVRHNYGNNLREMTIMTIALAPMAAVGAVAFLSSPWMACGLLVPYIASWRSAQQAARLEAAQKAASTDPLTGLPNRTAFFDRAARELTAAATYGHGLALIMGDLDNFKRVNDTRGHISGDHVLRATAAAMERVIDQAVFPLARYGGEEFVIACPVISRGETVMLAERLRSEIESALAEWGTSISLGVAYFQEGDRMESLVDRADKALYSAKFAGKNRVHEWPGDGIDKPMAVAIPNAAAVAADPEDDVQAA